MDVGPTQRASLGAADYAVDSLPAWLDTIHCRSMDLPDSPLLDRVRPSSSNADVRREPAMAVLATYRDCAQAGLARAHFQYALEPSRASRNRAGISRPQLWRRADRLGQVMGYVRRRAGRRAYHVRLGASDPHKQSGENCIF